MKWRAATTPSAAEPVVPLEPTEPVGPVGPEPMRPAERPLVDVN
jgi:hypothetical protein